MVKVLLCGDVDGEWEALTARVDALQNSAHGPFHILFFCGTVFKDAAEFDRIAPTVKFPLKCYAYDRTGVAEDAQLPDNFDFIVTTTATSDIGLATISNLTVGFMKQQASPSDIQDVKDMALATGYRGCDFLLTDDWPREMHHFIEESDLTELRATGVGLGIGSQAISSLTVALKPRYHIACGRSAFFQRPPYRNEISLTGLPSPCTRFVSLGKVSSSKDKNKKWLHALSLEPIIHLSGAEVATEPPGVTDCPYVEVGSVPPAGKRLKGADGASRPPPPPGDPTSASSAAFRPPPPPGPLPAGLSGNSGSFFFGRAGQGRDGSNTGGGTGTGTAPNAPNLIPPSEKATVLFIGGLNRESNDSELQRSLPGALNVRRPPGKSFAFVEFESHKAAKAVVEASVRRKVSLGGRTLSIGWGKEKEEASSGAGASISTTANGSVGGDNHNHHSSAPPVIPVHLEPPSDDCKTLFVGSLAPSTTREQILETLPKSLEVRRKPGKAFAFVEFESNEDATAVVKLSQAQEHPFAIDGRVMAIGWAKNFDHDAAATATATSEGGGNGEGEGNAAAAVVGSKRKHAVLTPPDAEAKTLFVGGLAPTVTSKELEAFFENVSDVRRPEGKDFAFIQFSSPEAARNTIERGTGDGVVLVLHGKHLTLGWAKGKLSDKFQAATDADCWFCLSSPSVKLHLVVSVGEQAYLALPRGGMSDYHCMISPVECVPSRINLNAAAKSDFFKYENAIKDLFDIIGCVPLYFERAIKTPFKDHMQQHCVPIPREKVSQTLPTFMKQADAAKLKFSEIMDSRDIDDVVKNMEGGPYQEYFYITLPIGDGDRSRRFVYVHNSSGAGESSSRRFPMQFGTQVAANILGDPHKSNWKNCVVSEEEEEALANKFRDAFEPYDFNL